MSYPNPVPASETVASNTPPESRRKFQIAALWVVSIVATAAISIGFTAAASPRSATSACLEALDHADTVIGYAAEGATESYEMFDALADGDISRMSSHGDDLVEVTQKLKEVDPKYNSAKTACRAGTNR